MMSCCEAIALIKKAAAARGRIRVADIDRHCRAVEVVPVRQAAYYAANELTRLSVSRISAHFDRDHTTVLGGLESVRTRMDRDPAYETFVFDLLEDLENRIGPELIVRHCMAGRRSYGRSYERSNKTERVSRAPRARSCQRCDTLFRARRELRICEPCQIHIERHAP